MFVLQISPRNDKIYKGGGIVKYIFSHCNEAVESASENRKFAFNYSDVQNPDQNIHIHDTCEVLFCIEGGENFLINDTVYTVEDGDVFVINQFEAHKITSNPVRVYHIFLASPSISFPYIVLNSIPASRICRTVLVFNWSLPSNKRSRAITLLGCSARMESITSWVATSNIRIKSLPFMA